MRSNGFKKILSLFMLALMAFGVFLRFWHLEAKPVHHDEAVNGWFLSQLWSQGFFNYDPTNYHGSLLIYFYHIAEFFFGTSIQVLRAVNSLFGVFTVFLIHFFLARRALQNDIARDGQHDRILSNSPISVAGLTSLVFLFSPAFFFFSRSAIHESVFVFFQALFILGLLELLEKPLIKSWHLCMWGLLGMMLLKETFAVLILALLLPLGLELRRQWAHWWNQCKREFQIRRQEFYKLIFLFLFSFIVLQSQFLQNGQDVLDFFIAFLPWLKTGTDHAGHSKPLEFWLETLWKYEPLILICAFLSLFGAFSKSMDTRLVSRTGVLVFLIYSLIPYKTIWCSISLFWLFVLGAGLWLLRRPFWIQTSAALVVLAGMLWQFPQGETLLYRDYRSTTHAYLYVETSAELMEVNSHIQSRWADFPLAKSGLLLWQAKELWPLPWLLQDMGRQLYVKEISSEYADAEVIVAETAERANLEANFGETHLMFDVPLRIEGPRVLLAVRRWAPQ